MPTTAVKKTSAMLAAPNPSPEDQPGGDRACDSNPARTAKARRSSGPNAARQGTHIRPYRRGVALVFFLWRRGLGECLRGFQHGACPTRPDGANGGPNHQCDGTAHYLRSSARQRAPPQTGSPGIPIGFLYRRQPPRSDSLCGPHPFFARGRVGRSLPRVRSVALLVVEQRESWDRVGPRAAPGATSLTPVVVFQGHYGRLHAFSCTGKGRPRRTARPIGCGRGLDRGRLILD